MLHGGKREKRKGPLLGGTPKDQPKSANEMETPDIINSFREYTSEVVKVRRQKGRLPNPEIRSEAEEEMIETRGQYFSAVP